MKKLVFSLMSVALCGFMAQGQSLTGTITGQVLDSNQDPVPGIAVFYFGVDTDVSSAVSYSKEDYVYNVYTDGQGNFSLSYYIANPNALNGDTIGIGVLDCQNNIVGFQRHVTSSNPNSTGNIQTSCEPGPCDVIITNDNWVNGNSRDVFWYAQALRDSAYALVGPNTAPLIHEWSFSDNYPATGHTHASWEGPNWDSIYRSLPASAPIPTACYKRTAQCNKVCDGATPLSCNADFFVDTVNSINFQGQVVIWENSTTDSTATIQGYRWGFGDGNTSNQQYPIHTYNDTGVYNVCLTIVSTRATATGIDTCTSTFCDSIGFDSNGNLIYKTTQQGFTINVIDPATVGAEEVTLESRFDLFPNPTTDAATLNWDASLGVQRIDVLSINGQLVRSIEPDAGAATINSLETGIYILRVQSEQGSAALRMVVQ